MHPDELQRLYSDVRVVVLGAGGFIGRRVAAALVDRGALVTGVVRSAAVADELRRELDMDAVVCDVTDDATLERVLDDARPSVTFNLIGYGVDPAERDPVIAHAINTELPDRLAARLTRSAGGWRGQGLVHAGSALEYGEASGDLSESSIPIPTTLYGRSKLAGTTAITERTRQSGARAVTARLFTVYGPGEHPGRLLPALLQTSITGNPLSLTAGTQRRDFTYVDDVAEGMLRLGATDADSAVVNLCTGRLESVRSFAEQAARVLGIDSALLKFGAVDTRAEEMNHQPVSIERLRSLTGWSPATPIEHGVLRTFEEMKRIGGYAQ